MALLKDVLFDNQWSSSSFQNSFAVNQLMKTGIVTPIRGSIRQDIDGLDSDNMKSVITSGIITRSFVEPKGMDASDNDLTPNQLSQTEFRVKTFYQAYSELERSIQQDIMPMSVADARVHLINVYGEYWATHWNKLMANMIKGMAGITAITVGDSTKNFSRQSVLDARKIRGDIGFGQIGMLYMSSGTVYDILSKIEAGTISQGTITETYGQSTIVENGIQTIVQSEIPTYKYNGVTPIVLDDDLADGFIGIIEKGAFGIGERNLKVPLESYRNPLAGNGSGVSQLVSRKSFVLHPMGFNFVGTMGTNFAKVSELTYAELQAGGLYTVADDVKATKITILKVKMG